MIKQLLGHFVKRGELGHVVPDINEFRLHIAPWCAVGEVRKLLLIKDYSNRRGNWP